MELKMGEIQKMPLFCSCRLTAYSRLFPRTIMNSCSTASLSTLMGSRSMWGSLAQTRLLRLLLTVKLANSRRTQSPPTSLSTLRKTLSHTWSTFATKITTFSIANFCRVSSTRRKFWSALSICKPPRLSLLFRPNRILRQIRRSWWPSFKRLWRATPPRSITFKTSLKTCCLIARQTVRMADTGNSKVEILPHSLLKSTLLNSSFNERHRLMLENGQEVTDENNSLTELYHRSYSSLEGEWLRPRRIVTSLKRKETIPLS